VHVPGRRFVLQVSGHYQPGDLDQVGHLGDRVRLTTVLLARVRDQAALQGLLRRVNDLGLSLVEVRETLEAPDPPTGPGMPIPITPPRAFEVAVDGPVGDVVASALADHIELLHVSSRYTFTDPLLMGEVLTRLLNRGADLERAMELPDCGTISSRRDLGTAAGGP
jgi:hypothetical protein